MDTVGILWATKDATVLYFLAQETKGSDTDRFWANLSPITFPEIKGGSGLGPWLVPMFCLYYLVM